MKKWFAALFLTLYTPAFAIVCHASVDDGLNAVIYQNEAGFGL